MKISVRDLRNIIREIIGTTPSVDDLTVTDDEFIEIILSETSKKMQENSVFEIVEITVAAFIGLAGMGITIGKAALIAKQLYHAIDDFRKDEVEAAAKALPSDVVEKVHEISDDAKLADMYEELNNMKGNATAEQVRTKSKQIKSYMKLKLSSHAGEVRASRQERNY